MTRLLDQDRRSRNAACPSFGVAGIGIGFGNGFGRVGVNRPASKPAVIAS